MRRGQSWFLLIPPAPFALMEPAPVAATFSVASPNGKGAGLLLNGDRRGDGENDALFVHGLRGRELSPCVIDHGTTRRLCEALKHQRCLSGLEPFDEERRKPAGAQAIQANSLLTIGLHIFDLYFPIAIVFNDDVLSSLAKMAVVEINNGANSEH